MITARYTGLLHELTEQNTRHFIERYVGPEWKLDTKPELSFDL